MLKQIYQGYRIGSTTSSELESHRGKTSHITLS